MPAALEDEFGDILQKARDGKAWSQKDLAGAVGIPLQAVARMERCEWTPPEDQVLALAAVLDLHGPSLLAIAREEWAPEPALAEAFLDLTCLQVFMGTYPVKCYLLTCPETGETAVVDTGANPEAILRKVQEKGVQVSQILLTHAHPDHAWGLEPLVEAFGCPVWIDPREPRLQGNRETRPLQDGDRLPLGRLSIEVISTPGHTPGGVSFRVHQTVLSGDAIFAGSMGRANSSWKDLFHSITRRLLTLPDEVRLHPGHGPATTVGEEKRHNPFFSGKV
ncbi:MAG: MBL fold metallo-hydrolase [Nitrospinaceae bacterium]